MATTQTGPRLTIAGTCEGCCWHAVPVPGERRCTEPSAQRKIARSVGAKAPAWCPELSAARLALARSVVVEGPFPRAGDAWFDAWAQSRGEDPNR